MRAGAGLWLGTQHQAGTSCPPPGHFCLAVRWQAVTLGGRLRRHMHHRCSMRIVIPELPVVTGPLFCRRLQIQQAAVSVTVNRKRCQNAQPRRELRFRSRLHRAAPQPQGDPNDRYGCKRDVRPGKDRSPANAQIPNCRARAPTSSAPSLA